jgi:ADP-ribosylglycohydrolase
MPNTQRSSETDTPWPAGKPAPTLMRKRFQGCLLGGAVGDALGAPVEFMTRDAILRRFGAAGITGYAPAYGGLGRITDDTQMTLFTAEGLLRGSVRESLKGIASYPGVTAHAYLRWLRTQGMRPHNDLTFGDELPGWLFGHKALHSRRAPGNTCLSALQEMTTLGEPARNNSKGCGGVMRVGPVGLFGWRLGQYDAPMPVFQLGAELAGLTHGHPTGALPGGVLAVMILALVGGASLPDALARAKDCLRACEHHEETLAAIELAESFAASATDHASAIGELGEGWIAEEALAISVYCALVARDFRDGVILAVNHDGDSDSTGAITGNLLGAMHGVDAIPAQWLAPLELRSVIEEMANDLFDFPDWDLDDASGSDLWKKYPGY